MILNNDGRAVPGPAVMVEVNMQTNGDKKPLAPRPAAAQPTAQPPPRPRPPAEEDAFDPAAITTQSPNLADRIVLYAPEKWGKTSFAAQAEEAVFLMSKGEDGILTLKRTGQVPPGVRHYPRPCENWGEAVKAVNALIVKGPHPRHFVLDVLNGFAGMLAEHVCREQFKSSWKNFNQFGGVEGWKNCLPEWEEFLGRLDRLRQLGSNILCLMHASVERVPNPDGLDYDRWQPALDKKVLWPATQRWADVIVFGGFEVFAEKADPQNARATKGKARGGTRLMYCEPTPTVAAGSRHGLPPQIEAGESAAEAWAAFQAALRGE
jgi:AAA domain